MEWIIGDVHGMLVPLRTLLDALRQRDKAATFYFAGDYCDRGPDTKGVVDLLIELTASGEAICVRGNHDDILDLCLNRKSFATGPEGGGDADKEAIDEAVSLFWREGLLETMRSYGVDLTEAGKLVGDLPAINAWVRDQFDRVPEAHKTFFRELPGVVEADDFFVVHATWPPDHVDDVGRMNGLLAADAFLRYDAIWGRYVANQIRSRKTWKRRGYVGHTPTDTYVAHTDLVRELGQVIHGEKLTLVDTACFAPGGRLSAVCHATGEIVQVHRSGELLD